MKFGTQIKPTSVKFLEWSALGLILATIATTLIYKYAKIDMTGYFYGILLMAASAFLFIEVGVMHYFRASTYKKLSGHEIIGAVISLVAGILLISGLVALPVWGYALPLALQGILFGASIMTGILVALSMIYVILTK